MHHIDTEVVMMAKRIRKGDGIECDNEAGRCLTFGVSVRCVVCGGMCV